MNKLTKILQKQKAYFKRRIFRANFQLRKWLNKKILMLSWWNRKRVNFISFCSSFFLLYNKPNILQMVMFLCFEYFKKNNICLEGKRKSLFSLFHFTLIHITWRMFHVWFSCELFLPIVSLWMYCVYILLWIINVSSETIPIQTGENSTFVSSRLQTDFFVSINI